MERLPWEITKMARKVKDVGFQVAISKSAQGVTGLESKKMVKDDVMENKGMDDDEEEEEDSDDETDTEEDEDEDSDDDENYGVYSVATKEEYVPVEIKTKKKTKGGKQGLREEGEGDNAEAEEAEEAWSQQQQKSLEQALKQFPKGTAERWERIASKVSGKSKEQCMARFKNLAEAIRKKKEQEQAGCGGGGDSSRVEEVA